MSAASSGTRNFHMIEAVAERLEGAPRQFRRRWSDDFKARAVAEAMEPGASVSAIAHRLGIHPSQLFGWRRDARDGQRSVSRDRAVQTETRSIGRRSMIELVIGDIVIRADADIDDGHLQRVIRAVRSA
ncbi:transposase [Rhizobium rhizogenes]|nr:transposase [Rhizobium rhizogenes]